MSISSKKLVSAVLTAATILSMGGVAAMPLAQAQTTSDLQAQIQALLAQIAQLQAQLNTGTSSSGSTTSYNFTRDLTVGSTGADVTALQQLLISKGYLAISAPTAYFGSLTKAAVAKWQAATGISPAAGYFGPKSRAVVNAMSVPGGTTTGTGSTGGTVTAPATGLAVSLASNNPAAGSLVSGSARIPVLAVNFTAGNSGAVTVSEVKFHKTGVLSDSAITGAYLVQNGQVIAQYNSINQGVIDFSGLNWQIAAGQTQNVMLAIDTSVSGSNGNTTGFSLNSASDVSSFDTNNTAVTATGVFPINGNIFTLTTVTNPGLASLTIGSSSIGQTVTAGTQGDLVAAYTFNVGTNKVWLKGLNFHVIGSANKGDVRNVKLMVNGTQAGATLSAVPQTGLAYFDLSANPIALNTGNNNIQIFADVMGSPNMFFQFEVLNSYDVLAVDSQYNVPVAVTNTGGSASTEQVNIQPGQTTVTQDTNTPTGNIAKGQSQVTLAKFDFYASGEAVRVKFLTFQLAFTGATTTLSNMVRNVSLVDDAGGQIGSTINTPPTGNTCDVNGNATSSGYGPVGAVYTDCFGTSASPINYVVPANTTRVLSLKADIQSMATFTGVTASLAGNQSNFQGVISSNTGSSGAAQGSSLSLANSQITAARNNGVGNQTVSAGVTNQRIGSYSLTASSAEGVNVSNVTIQANGAFFQNLKALINGAQFGTTQGSVASGSAYTFSGTPFNIPAGQTVNVDVYADTLSSGSGLITPATELTGLTGTGQVSFSAISLPSTVVPVIGQNLTFASGATISVGADSTQPPAGQIVMGSTGNTLAIFRFTETSNVENIKITDLTVHATTSAIGANAAKAAFSNVTLWNGSTLVGTAGAASTSNGGFDYSFHGLGSSVIIPQANSVSLTLKGDAASYASQGALDSATTTFGITATTTASITALGATSNRTTNVSSVSGASGNTQTVLRSTLTVSAAALNGTNHTKQTADDIGTITFSANNAGPVAVNTTTVTLSGTGATSTVALMQLIDANGNDAVIAGEAASSSSGTAKTWSFLNGGWQVSAGGSYTFKIRVNSTLIPQAGNGQSNSLSATVQGANDIQYTDALDASGTAFIGLPTSLVPITINSVSYPSGQ